MRQMIKRLKAAYAGSAILLSWLGDGGLPVEEAKAEGRSGICKHGGGSNKPCPYNAQGDWWEKVTAQVAMAVMDERRAKMDLGLRVANEHLLGTCDVCLCHLPTKVWVPIENILKHTSKEVWNELPAYCWIKTEGSTVAPKLKPDGS